MAMTQAYRHTLDSTITHAIVNFGFFSRGRNTSVLELWFRCQRWLRVVEINLVEGVSIYQLFVWAVCLLTNSALFTVYSLPFSYAQKIAPGPVWGMAAAFILLVYVGSFAKRMYPLPERLKQGLFERGIDSRMWALTCAAMWASAMSGSLLLQDASLPSAWVWLGQTVVFTFLTWRHTTDESY